MKGLNLSKLKKVSSDDKCTVFQHPDGHSVRIAHGGLSPELKKELDKVPMANGGMVKKYAEGTPDEPVYNEYQAEDSAQQPKKDAPVVINVGAQPPQAAAAAQPVPQTDNAAAAEQQPAATQPTQQSPQNTLAPAQQEQAATVEAVQPPSPQTQNVEQGQAVAPAEPSVQNKPATYQDIKNTQIQHYTTEDQAFQNDLNNGHITPETYKDLFAKKATLGKIGMIFGALAGGAGAGLTGHPNAMLEMMNNEIKNDLDAQMKSKDNAKTWIGLNQAHLANQANIGLTQAQQVNTKAESDIKTRAFANMQMNRAALHQMVQQMNALPMGSPERDRAEQALAMMSQGVQNENFNIADRASAAGAFANMLQTKANGDESGFQNRTNMLRLMGPQGETAAKNLEEKHLPGVKGQASVPLSGSDRDSVSSSVAFDQKLHRFIDWTKTHSGDLNPADMKEGQALAAELSGAYRQATHGGVYKEGEQNFISKLIDEKPTKFFNSIRVLPQLNALAGESRARIDQLVRSKGFNGYEPVNGAQKQDQSQPSNEIERVDPKSGKTVIYDAQTKKPLRWK